ncbi:unnamed protein product [Enterobius vermicularis]|uniref:Clathrin_bdg domain-containing protein n=1 Tax=Enterobius vermicularis TaxID=51028 RepID=A0A0N4V8U8_ENTVE|nr:unnamed protein product [Enterobius vermicularis]
MEIGVENGRTLDEQYDSSAQCDYLSFTDEFPNDYDPNLEFASFFSDVDLNSDINLSDTSCYSSFDSVQTPSRTSAPWSPPPSENGQCYNYSQTGNNDSFIASETVPGLTSTEQNDVHPWQDINLSYADDSLLFDSEL